MHIRVGYELIYNCPQETPMILIVNIHYSRASDIVIPDYLTTEPSVPITAYRDPFGNWYSLNETNDIADNAEEISKHYAPGDAG